MGINIYESLILPAVVTAVVGLWILAKGHKINSYLSKLPRKVRVFILMKAYKNAIDNPYGFLHMLLIPFLVSVFLAFFLFFISLSYGILYALIFSESFVISTPTDSDISVFFVLIISLIYAFLLLKVSYILFLDALLPTVKENLEAVNNFILAYGTPEEFIEYLRVRKNIRSIKDVKFFFQQIEGITDKYKKDALIGIVGNFYKEDNSENPQ